ncbi:SGNH/GDSL hydrolase family protein [Nocardia bhagyanarayanae]|uniref:Lysophospholipase L1-like esterase n=1 Tax=Nocardia bhagyanarayanae TaxID=1215925 RepID=A0A543FGT4_9NOCA|nr:SGNH/GDSL hydrolase family protein [Nocardia bhagyanarayanae]TQM33001.1 lysophospholipase L1-like esterase [Nocardia bhagyanarayanae]
MVKVVRTRIAAAFTTAITAGLVLAAAAPTQAAPSPGPYVAMGDSYSAGSGIVPLDPTVTPACARTTRNYPNLIADALGVEAFSDVTCGNADTQDFYESQYPSLTPQLDAVTRETKLVTLTIGGNNNDTLIKVISACMSAGTGTAGLGNPCETLYGDQFTNDILNKTYPAVKKALTDIHAKAPSAKVAILAYPQVMPEDNTNCFLTMPIAKGDVAYINNIEDTLNGVVERAAGETGTIFVDMRSSIGHDACKPIGVRWVEPAVWGTNFVPIHPNALGMQKMAEQALAAIG